MRIIHGFGSGVNLNQNHLNPEFSGKNQDFPQTPIDYDAFQPVWAISSTSTITIVGEQTL